MLLTVQVWAQVIFLVWGNASFDFAIVLFQTRFSQHWSAACVLKGILVDFLYRIGKYWLIFFQWILIVSNFLSLSILWSCDIVLSTWNMFFSVVGSFQSRKKIYFLCVFDFVWLLTFYSFIICAIVYEWRLFLFLLIPRLCINTYHVYTLLTEVLLVLSIFGAISRRVLVLWPNRCNA